MLFRSKNETKNPRTKKGNSQKPKQKKQHFCHHCSLAEHTRPNCYKWLATQKSNNIIASEDQNQFPSSFAPLGDLFKTLIFLSNLNGFNSSPSPPDQGFAKGKDFPRRRRKRVPNDSVTSSLSPLFVFCVCITCVFCFHVLSQSSFMHCFVLFNMFLFGYFSVLFYFVFHI